MIILRKNFSLSEIREKNRRKKEKKPEGLEKLAPSRSRDAHLQRWRRFNDEVGGNRWRLNIGKTRKKFNAWQKEKYGDVIYK